MLNICIIIPVFNEEQGLKALLPSVKACTDCDIVVINDASHDSSKVIAEESEGVVVLTNDKQSGKGFSLRKGFQYAIDRGYEGVLTMDGDGQHLASDIGSFLTSSNLSLDCVINGNRMNNAQKMPLIRRLTNRFMSLIISMACRQTIADTQCGFRYVGGSVLKNITLQCDGFEIETEILMKTRKKGFPIYSVDIETIYCDEKSKINPFRDTIRFFSYFFKELYSRSSDD